MGNSQQRQERVQPPVQPNAPRQAPECSICMTEFDREVRPGTLTCGHTFCIPCINKLPMPNCPECRNPILTIPAPNIMFEELCAQVNPMSDSELKESFNTMAAANFKSLKENRELKVQVNNMNQEIHQLQSCVKLSNGTLASECTRLNADIACLHRQNNFMRAGLERSDEIIRRLEHDIAEMDKLAEHRDNIMKTVLDSADELFDQLEARCPACKKDDGPSVCMNSAWVKNIRYIV